MDENNICDPSSKPEVYLRAEIVILISGKIIKRSFKNNSKIVY